MPRSAFVRGAGYASVVAGLCLIGAGTALSAANDDPTGKAAAEPAPIRTFAPPHRSDTQEPKPVAASPGRDAPYQRLPTALVLPSRPRATVVPVGVRSDGSLLLPSVEEVGWWSGGSDPGGPGATVLAGHLDDESGRLGPLAEIRSFHRGDHIAVDTLTGAVNYHVVAVQQYHKTQIPQSVFSRTGPSRLVLITCGGAYTPGRGYADNIVATAEPTQK